MNLFCSAVNTFDDIYLSVHMPVVIFDLQAIIVKANPAFLDLVKAGSESYQSLVVTSFFQNYINDIDVFKNISEHTVVEITDAEGSTIPIIFHYNELKDIRGNLQGGMLFITDVRDLFLPPTSRPAFDQFPGKDPQTIKIPDQLLQEKKKLEQDAKEARDFLLDVVESCGDGIIIADSTGKISYVNESLLNILKKDKNLIIGRAFYELGPMDGTFRATTGEEIALDKSYAENQISKVEKIRSLKDSGKISNWEWYAFTTNNEIVPLEVTVSTRRSAEGMIHGFICVFRDITEKKKADNALEQAYRFRSQFYANITHEFRTPLTLSLGPIEEILRGEFGPVNSDINEQLSVAMNNSRQLLKLVNQLLDFSMLEAGSKNLMYEKRDPNRFIQTVLDAFSSISNRKNIQLIFVPAADIREAYIDPVKTEKSLFNLLGNSFKYTAPKGRITVAAEFVTAGQVSVLDEGALQQGSSYIKDHTPSEYLKISVKDTGIGIKKNELKGIFDRFKQGSSTAKEYEGSGIGLAHTRELVDLMGGEITVESEFGKGSVFTLYLPLEINRPDGAISETDNARQGLYLDPEVELSDIQLDDDILEESISGSKPLVLIVDDDLVVRRYVSMIVKPLYDYIEARNGTEALERLKVYHPDIILCDIMMPEMDGYEFLKQLKDLPDFRHIPLIFLTARADSEMKVEGLEEGAADYIVKPFSSLELLARIKSILRLRTLMSKTEEQERRITSLTEKLESRYSYGNIIGSSSAMQNIYQLTDTIKDSDSTVLITGETGTGKELIANAIHYGSPRKNFPMVSVNCGAIPKELMEREFFGHVKGSFTGAVDSKNGYFEEADGGTLFLDEIGEMNKDIQVKLLRVLEQGEIVRVGDSVPKKVNVRLIAATNKDLRAEVEKGGFREDLYYRIFVLPIHMPPLRDRVDDIPLLVDHFLKKFRKKTKTNVPEFPKKQLKHFLTYAYPGNVRELENMVERYCLLGENTDNLLGFNMAGPGEYPVKAAVDETTFSGTSLKKASVTASTKAEKVLILQTLAACNNNRTEAARQLNISRASLYRKLKRFKIST